MGAKLTVDVHCEGATESENEPHVKFADADIVLDCPPEPSIGAARDPRR